MKLNDEDEKFIKFLDEKNIEYSSLDNKTILFLGKASHGSLPLLGKNAFLIAINAIGEYYDELDLKELYSLLADQEGKGLDNEEYSIFFSSKNLINFSSSSLSFTIALSIQILKSIVGLSIKKIVTLHLYILILMAL